MRTSVYALCESQLVWHTACSVARGVRPSSTTMIAICTLVLLQPLLLTVTANDASISVTATRTATHASALPSLLPTPSVSLQIQSTVAHPPPSLPPPGDNRDPPLLPPGIQPLLPHQCATGADEVSLQSTTGYASTGVLYVDMGRRAQCSGVVERWEVCYSMEPGTLPEMNSFDIVVLREESRGLVQRVAGVYSLAVIDVDPEAAEQTIARCTSAMPLESIPIEVGDRIGFTSSGSIRVALAKDDDSYLYQFINQMNQERKVAVSTSDTILQNQLQLANQTTIPLIRAVVNITYPSSGIVLSTTMNPQPTDDPDPCDNTNSTKRKFLGIFSTSTLIAVFVVAIVVIFVLILVVCVLGFCLCKAKCCTCLRRRKKQAVNDLQSVSDESMQYNELYTPCDPQRIIIGGRMYTASIGDNPAYSPTNTNSVEEAVNTVDAPPDVVISGQRGVDHTYESVR